MISIKSITSTSVLSLLLAWSFVPFVHANCENSSYQIVTCKFWSAWRTDSGFVLSVFRDHRAHTACHLDKRRCEPRSMD